MDRSAPSTDEQPSIRVDRGDVTEQRSPHGQKLASRMNIPRPRWTYAGLRAAVGMPSEGRAPWPWPPSAPTPGITARAARGRRSRCEPDGRPFTIDPAHSPSSANSFVSSVVAVGAQCQ